MADMGMLSFQTPEEVALARKAEEDARNMQMSQMGLGQSARYGMLSAGSALGNAIGAATGYVDPNEARAQKIQQVMSSPDSDLNTSKGMLAKAAELRTIDPRLSMQLLLKGRELEKQEQAAVLNTAKANYYNREKPDPKEIMMLEIANDPEETPEKRKMAADWLAKNGKGGSGGTGRTQTLSTSVGMLNFDPYTKRYTYADGSDVPADKLRSMTPIGNDPTNAAAVATAKAGGVEVGKAAGGALAQLPKIENDLVTIQGLGTKLFNHPGYKSLVGAGFPGLKYLQGSAVPGAKALVDQIQGIGYLMAREELRSQGQVTEGEATAATAAFNRMNAATSEADFREAYNDFVKRVDNVRSILRQKAGMKFDQSPFQTAPVAPVVPTSPVTKPFSGVTSPSQVKQMFQNGTLNREQAKAILADMEARGVK